MPVASPKLDLWFVLLMPRRQVGGRRWWQWLLDPQATHVAAVRSDGPHRCLVVHPMGSLTQLEPAPYPAAQIARGLQVEWQATALRLALPRPTPRAALRPPATCVEIVKSCLGLRAPWVLTPRQLRRHLLAIGATPLPHPLSPRGLVAQMEESHGW